MSSISVSCLLSIRYRFFSCGAAFMLFVLAWLMSTAQAVQGLSVQALRFIGEQQIPHKQPFQGTTVGGLSGIDYDAGTDTWILASDDRSDFDASRFYTAKLAYDGQAFTSMTLTSTVPFRQRSEEHTSELQSLMRTSYA